MLYFTREGFRRLANQNRGHIRVMLECVFKEESTTFNRFALRG